ncbi:protein BNIP5 [Cavia porcellus]|uniref:protein BNIP5 n=1 Tax=Cavia porcellus TaxID=10141 RepID=UPI002FE32AC2
MENRRAPRRARSLDRPRVLRKDSETSSCQCLSLPSTPCRWAPCRAIGEGARGSQSLDSPPSGAQDAEGAAVHTPEETRGFLPSEQRPPPDIKKDKAQWRAQQGWLKMVLNFLWRTGFEEPRDKASRRPKEKEEPPESPETAEELGLRKKALDRKASRKKHGHKKHGAAEAAGNQDREARPPRTAAASQAEDPEAALVCRGGRDSGDHLSLPSRGASAGQLDSSPQATGSGPEEEPGRPDQDDVIRMIVEFLKKVGDQWEEEQSQASQPAVLLQNPALGCTRKSQEKKPSSHKRAFSLKKYSSEEPRRVATADVPSPRGRPPKRPSFLPLCMGGGGPRPSTSSSPGCEGPGAPEAPSADSDSPSPPELPTRAACQRPEDELPLDGTSESSEFMRMILGLLQDAEEQAGEQQPQVQEADAAGEGLALAGRWKAQEKKPSGLRRAFSHKRHSFKEPRRAGAARTGGAATPESRPPKRPSFLPLCVGGQRTSISCSSDGEEPEFLEPSAAEGAAPVFPEVASKASSCTPDGGPQPPQEGACKSKELIICKLVALLQEVDGELGKQIQRHPSFKRFFYEFSDSALRKLVATLSSQQAHLADGDGGLPTRPFPFTLGLGSRYTDSHRRTICSLMGSRGGAQTLSREAQPNLTSPDCQSPD